MTITGNTYPVRAELKALGGRWNPAEQGWDFADETTAEKAREIVTAAGPSTYTPRSRGRGRYRSTSTYTRFSSGAEVYTNKNGRCEDAPCCGCCS